jgi:serine/threonine-protein kinase
LSGSKVALKLLERSAGCDDKMLARFAREARAAAALRGPHVVRILDHGIDADTSFIAMELLVGETLRSRIARTKGLAAIDALRFMRQVLAAIREAHEAGIVHRDLKPDNVFIVQGDPEIVKVLDFGIAKLQKNAVDESSSSVTDTGMMIGTPYYMSPEQAQAQSVDHRSDLFTIAVIAFEAVTGKRPFGGESFGELVVSLCTSPVPIPSKLGKVPRGFDEWFVRGTQRDRARRFQSAREMADELARIVTNVTLPMAALPAIVAPRTVPPPVISASDDASEVGTSRQNPLELTTGQHAAVSSGSSVRPRPSRSASLVALVALGAVILAGVFAFVLSGGASAIRAEKVAREAAERAPAHGAALPVPSVPLSAALPASRPSASVAPRAFAVPAKDANLY